MNMIEKPHMISTEYDVKQRSDIECKLLITMSRETRLHTKLHYQIEWIVVESGDQPTFGMFFTHHSMRSQLLFQKNKEMEP